jgi:homoserine kinase type II
MFEGRTEVAELPFFLGLLDHLAGKGCPVPRTIHDRAGASFRTVDGKAVALIEFLPGVSVASPRRRRPARWAGRWGRSTWPPPIFPPPAPTRWGWPAGAICWRPAARMGWPRSTRPARAGSAGKAALAAAWPDALPRSTIHADLFPDNVLMLGETGHRPDRLLFRLHRHHRL